MTDRTAAEVMCCPSGCERDAPRLGGKCASSAFQRDVDALHNAGYMIVPREPTTDMIQDGCDAGCAARRAGISGMTIEAQIQAQAYRELAIYRAMTANGELK